MIDNERLASLIDNLAIAKPFLEFWRCGLLFGLKQLAFRRFPQIFLLCFINLCRLRFIALPIALASAGFVRNGFVQFLAGCLFAGPLDVLYEVSSFGGSLTGAVFRHSAFAE